MRTLFLALAIIPAIACPALPQGQPDAKAPAAGVVHPSIAVAADSSHSYALYLPSGYNASRRWPVLLVFDPFARGEVGVKLFHDAAEKYGFIVAGSNNSRNFQDPSEAVRLLWDDVKERYAVDPARLYTAGLSGGARVAASVALSCGKCIAGVIANGAGLSQGAEVPGPEVAEWFLVAGTTDFNYPELSHLKDALDAHGDVSRFVVYDGPHGWMPPDFAERALAWFQMRAMARMLAPADKEFLARQFDSRLAEAQAMQKSGDVIAAARAYRELAADFRSLREVKELESLAKSLAESEDFRKARKNEKATFDMQDETAKKIGGYVAGIVQGAGNSADYLTQLQLAVSDAVRDQRGGNATRRQAVARGMASAFAYAVESGQQAMLKKNYLPAKDLFQAGETIMPESAWASYLLATAQAQLGEKKQAIQSLNKALEKGMTNPRVLEDSAFDKIREDAGFKKVQAKLAQAASK